MSSNNNNINDESKTNGAGSKVFLPTEHSNSTIIYNASNHTMIVFQERAASGTYYNVQVLHPGEALSMTRQQSAAVTGFAGRDRLLPRIGLVSSYKVHAIVGDESSLASLADESTLNLLKNAAIPAAFVIGCLVTAVAAGTLAGPSVALAPLVSGVVVNGVVVDSAAIAAGTVLATRAKAITEMIIKDKSGGEMLAAKTKGMQPPKKGKGRFLVVTGGLSDGAVTIAEVGSRDKFEKRYGVSVWKAPMNNCNGSCSSGGGCVGDGGGENRKQIWRIGTSR